MITYPNAEDENGNVHNIDSITKENRYEHRFFCLGCGEEMVPVLFPDGQKTSHFRHKKNDGQCNPETYLHNLTKKAIAKRFTESQKFEISYYTRNRCPNRSTCNIYSKHHERVCSGIYLHTEDLKKHYDTCQMEGVYDGYRADVLLSNSKDASIKPVFIEVSVSHDCTPEKLASGNRIIEIKVHKEEDAQCILQENIGDYVPKPKPDLQSLEYYNPLMPPEPERPTIGFYGFPRESQKDGKVELDCFALLSNGHFAWKEKFTDCRWINAQAAMNSIFEVKVYNNPRFKNNKPSYNFRTLGLAEAMLHKMPVRNCYYCEHFNRCRIPMEVETYNHNTRQREKVIQRVPNSSVKHDKVDRYKLADSCKNWKVNEYFCNHIIEEYRRKEIFIWKPEKEEPGKE